MDFWDELSDRYKGDSAWQNLLGDAGSLSYKNGYENQGAWGAVGKAIDSGNRPRTTDEMGPPAPEGTSSFMGPPRAKPPNPYETAGQVAQPMMPSSAPQSPGGMDLGATQENAKTAMAGMQQPTMQAKKPEPYKPDMSWIGAVISALV